MDTQRTADLPSQGSDHAARLGLKMAKITAWCRKWRVKELALFGSAVRHDFGPHSDLDLLVTFHDDAPWSLWDLVAMQEELQEHLGREVDLIEQTGLHNPYRRSEILRTKEVIYAA